MYACRQVQANFVTDAHRVPGVGPAVETHDNIERRAEQIDDLTFAFVAPLRPKTHVCGGLLALIDCRTGGVRVRFGQYTLPDRQPPTETHFKPNCHRITPRRCCQPDVDRFRQ